MPFYFRKTVSAGPFRFNLSNSGIGISVGVKGLRVGTGPRGHYVHAGRGGLYYRASLGRARSTSAPRLPYPVSPHHPPIHAERDGVTMIDVQSGDVDTMRDATVADFLDDLNKKQAQTPIGLVAAGSLALIGVLALWLSNSGGQPVLVVVGTIALLATLPAWIIGEWFDSYKRTSVLFYNLEGAAETIYRRVTEGFDALAACHGRWHIDSGGVVRDLTTWKRNAGAAHLLSRKSAQLAYDLPKVLRSNITPPALTLGSRTFYFFPEIMLVKHGGRFGAVGYDDLQIRGEASLFIEDGNAPADAQVVDHTWQHPNKGGGPDRRFRDNRQLPVCLYDVMHLSSNSGVNELVQFSRAGSTQSFTTALHDLPRKQEIGGLALLEKSSAPEKFDVTADPLEPQSRKWKLAAYATVLIVGGAGMAAYALRADLRTSLGIHGSVAELFAPPPVGTVQTRAPVNGVVTQIPSDTSIRPVTPNVPTATVKSAANLRNGPSISAAIIRVAGPGEKFGVFGRANGWVQVGTDKPLGWISASLLAE